MIIPPPPACTIPFRQVVNLKQHTMLKSRLAKGAFTIPQKESLNGVVFRRLCNKAPRNIPKSSPVAAASRYTQNVLHHESYAKGCVTGYFLTFTAYTMYDYFRTRESLIRKGEYLIELGTADATTWKGRFAERREWLAAHHRLHEGCRRGEEKCQLCLTKQQENKAHRMLKDWVWRITEDALSENAPGWVYNTTLRTTYDSWKEGGILGTWWGEIEPEQIRKAGK
jgi:hypothetical protein